MSFRNQTIKYYSPQQLADLLQTNVQTLATWRSTGRYKLPFIKCGSKVLYQAEDIDAWLQSRLCKHTGEIKA